MRKAFKHTGVLMMAAVIGLAVVGAAYALWFENLTLTATVQTGTFDVDWSCDNGTNGAVANTNSITDCTGSAVAQVSQNEGGTWTNFPDGKPPVTCTAGISSSVSTANDSNDHSTGGNSNNVLTLSAGDTSGGGLYPYTSCDYYIDIHNNGSVPAHFNIGAIDCSAGTICAAVTAGYIQVSVVDAGCFGTCATNSALETNALAACNALFGGSSNTATHLATYGTDNTAVQLHTSNHLGCHIRIRAIETATDGTVLPENAAFHQTYSIQGRQWNENP